MALTAEQKEANKKARKERDQAYRARYKAWNSAHTAALAPLSIHKEETAITTSRAQVVLDVWAASEAFEAALAAANAEEQAIRAKIAELTESLKDVRNHHNQTALADARRIAYDAWNAARKAAEAEVDANFPDVANVYSAAEWGAKTGFGQDKS